jgi:hypothetical protein
MSLIGLVVTVVILGLVFYLLYWLISQIPMPPPFQVVAKVILALAAVILLLSLIPGFHIGGLGAIGCER